MISEIVDVIVKHFRDYDVLVEKQSDKAIVYIYKNNKLLLKFTVYRGLHEALSQR